MQTRRRPKRPAGTGEQRAWRHGLMGCLRKASVQVAGGSTVALQEPGRESPARPKHSLPVPHPDIPAPQTNDRSRLSWTSTLACVPSTRLGHLDFVSLAETGCCTVAIVLYFHHTCFHSFCECESDSCVHEGSASVCMSEGLLVCIKRPRSDTNWRGHLTLRPVQSQ